MSTDTACILLFFFQRTCRRCCYASTDDETWEATDWVDWQNQRDRATAPAGLYDVTYLLTWFRVFAGTDDSQDETDCKSPETRYDHQRCWNLRGYLACIRTVAMGWSGVVQPQAPAIFWVPKLFRGFVYFRLFS